MFSKILIAFSLILVCFSSKAQPYMDLKEKQNLRNHALDNIKEFENILNEITSSNNPEEKKVIILNCKETVFDKSANIEDDLNPESSISKFSDFIPLDVYLERFPLLFKPDYQSTKSVTFTNIYVSDVHTDEYTYINVCFECIFTGNHKVTKTKYKKVLRLATIKTFRNNGRTITKIVTVKFSNPTEFQRITKESVAFDNEFQKNISVNQTLTNNGSQEQQKNIADTLNFNLPVGNPEIALRKNGYSNSKSKILVSEPSLFKTKLFPSKFGILGVDYGLDQLRINGGYVIQGFLLSGGVQINLNSYKRMTKTDLAIENVSVYDNELYKEEIGRIYSKSSIPHSFSVKTGYTITRPIFIILTVGLSFIETDEFQNVFEAKHDYIAEDSWLIIKKGDLFPEPFLKKNAYTVYTAGLILPIARTFFFSTDYYSNSDTGPGFSFGLGILLK